MCAKLNRQYELSQAPASILHNGSEYVEHEFPEKKHIQCGMTNTNFNIINGGSMLVFLIDGNGIILSLSGDLTREFGLKVPNLLGTSIYDNYTGNNDVLSVIANIIKNGLNQWIFENEGNIYELCVNTVTAPGYDMNGYIGTLTDIGFNRPDMAGNSMHSIFFDDLFEHLPVAIVILDENSRVLRINKEFTSIFQYTPDEVISKTRFEVLVPENLQSESASMLDKIHNGQIVQVETKRKRKDGSLIDVTIIGNGVKLDSGEKGGYLIYTDITKKKKADEQILNSLLEKELLLQEVHHRVKNNLQVVSSLLYLQSKAIKDPNVINMFVECQNRVKSISLIHERLYQTRDISRIDFDQYIRSLIYNLFDSFGVKQGQIAFKLRSENIFMGTDSAIPCGLIINELVTNSLKYAFPENRKGEISIEVIYHQDNKFTLSIKDNGVGLPESYDFLNAETLGSRLVQSLVKQLDGTLEIESKNGTEFKISFSILNYKGGCN